ncbi:FecR family protein [Pinibacter soli]|uniref:FecR domain-containing protein n=1 Tax=Pinibacter soli TaxID=3044211 RepID=A0ABT6RB72_9BACT|nr:FecR domain-containing protein [Pinibacter soli]MDI3319805.1 FecR domain-containing protein [Pinibacter soli]
MTHQELFLELFARYISGEITPQEYQQLQVMIHQPAYESLLSDELKRTLIENTYGEIDLPLSTDDFIKGLQKRMPVEMEAEKALPVSNVKTMYGARKWMAAAAMLLAVATGAYFLLHKNTAETVVLAKDTSAKQDILPGSSKAILQLANGATVGLDEKGDTQLPSDSGVKIMKHGSELAYIAKTATEDIKYNKVITPAGGQYKLTLSDGTKVWLDAMSSIYFPTAFTGKERVVEVTGQVYFEVASNVGKPFSVKVKQSIVNVLGTHFNINAYDDEGEMKTTLLEGAVQVKQQEQELRLRPGQQAQIDAGGKLKIAIQPNLEETMAWKDGMFVFEGTDIKTIMRQLARWYDLTIEYKDNIHGVFVAKIPRNVGLSEILKLLELTKQVKFVVEGKRIIATNA